MAKRPIFIPKISRPPFVEEVLINFAWHSGYSKSQAQKSIISLHESAAQIGINSILEISTKSINPLGVALSAFNLELQVKGQKLSVECAYQGSKVFKEGGPYTDLYYVSSKEAKTDDRIRNTTGFIGYELFGRPFPSKPVTAFYDWLYLRALWQNPNLSHQLLQFQGFSDIAFNPEKSLNCQARAAALFVSLYQNNEIDNVLRDIEHYLSLITNNLSSLPSLNLHKHCISKKAGSELQHNKDLETTSELYTNDFIQVSKKPDEIERSNQMANQDDQLLDFDVFKNFFLPNIESALSDERTKEEIIQMFGISQKLATEWLKKAEEIGRIKRLIRPTRYIASSCIPVEQLAVDFSS